MIRFATPADGAALAAIYAPIVKTTAISFEEIAPDAAEMSSRIASHAPEKPWIVDERDGVVLGYAYASTFRNRSAYRFNAEVTVYVGGNARRAGIGKRLYAALLALLTAQGYRRAWAGITLPNDASLALHAAVGFTRVAVFEAAGYKFGRWHDLAFMGRPLNALGAPEHDPLPVAQLEAATIAAAFAG